MDFTILKGGCNEVAILKEQMELINTSYIGQVNTCRKHTSFHLPVQRACAKLFQR